MERSKRTESKKNLRFFENKYIDYDIKLRTFKHTTKFRAFFTTNFELIISKETSNIYK